MPDIVCHRIGKAVSTVDAVLVVLCFALCPSLLIAVDNSHYLRRIVLFGKRSPFGYATTHRVQR